MHVAFDLPCQYIIWTYSLTHSLTPHPSILAGIRPPLVSMDDTYLDKLREAMIIGKVMNK